MSIAQELIDRIDGRVGELHETALEELRKFQNIRVRGKAKGEKKEWGKLILLVTERGRNSFQITWHRKKWVRKTNVSPGENPWLMHSTYIKKGKADRYPMKTLLAEVAPWEKEEIPRFEDVFAQIRSELGALMKCKKILVGYLQHKTAQLDGGELSRR